MRLAGVSGAWLSLAAASALAAASSIAPLHAAPAPTGTLTLHSGDRAVRAGDTLAQDEALTFHVEGSPGRYLYLLETGDGSVAIIHPHVGQVLPSDEPATLVPQPTWLTEQDEERTGWTPELSGPITYLLVSSPAPRDAPSDLRLRSVEQLLEPPPYVAGPMGGKAVVVATVQVRRDEPPDE